MAQKCKQLGFTIDIEKSLGSLPEGALPEPIIPTQGGTLVNVQEQSQSFTAWDRAISSCEVKMRTMNKRSAKDDLRCMAHLHAESNQI